MAQTAFIKAILKSVFVLFQKVLIAETPLNVLLGDIDKLHLIKTTLQQLMFISLRNEQFFIYAL